jgi:hypothetical protein
LISISIVYALMIGLTRLKLQDGVFAGPNPDVENHNRKAIRTTSVPTMRDVSPVGGGVRPRSGRINARLVQSSDQARGPLLGDCSRVTAQALLLIASTGAAIWKFTRLKGFGTASGSKITPTGNDWRGNEVLLSRPKVQYSWGSAVQVTGHLCFSASRDAFQNQRNSNLSLAGWLADGSAGAAGAEPTRGSAADEGADEGVRPTRQPS